MVQETQAYDIYPLVSGIVIILFITFSIFNNLSQCPLLMHVNNSFYKYNNNSSAFSQVRPNYLYIITIFFKYRWGLSYLLKLMPFSIMPSSIFISSFTFHPYTIFGSNDYYHQHPLSPIQLVKFHMLFKIIPYTVSIVIKSLQTVSSIKQSYKNFHTKSVYALIKLRNSSNNKLLLYSLFFLILDETFSKSFISFFIFFLFIFYLKTASKVFIGQENIVRLWTICWMELEKHLQNTTNSFTSLFPSSLNRSMNIVSGTITLEFQMCLSLYSDFYTFDNSPFLSSSNSLSGGTLFLCDCLNMKGKDSVSPSFRIDQFIRSIISIQVPQSFYIFQIMSPSFWFNSIFAIFSQKYFWLFQLTFFSPQ